MRRLNEDLKRLISSPASISVWLLSIGLPGAAVSYFLCSRADGVSYNGQTWEQANFTVSGPSVRAGGGLEASIVIDGHDTLIAHFLTSDWEGCTGSLYLTYYDDDLTLATPKLMLSGDVYGSSLVQRRLTIQLTAGGNRKSVTPWLVIGPPVFNHLTPRGTLLVWGSQRYILDRE